MFQEQKFIKDIVAKKLNIKMHSAKEFYKIHFCTTNISM